VKPRLEPSARKGTTRRSESGEGCFDVSGVLSQRGSGRGKTALDDEGLQRRARPPKGKAGPQSTVSQTRGIGAQAIERSCSRSVLIAEVDERRLAIPPDGGRSSLSSFTGAKGERASEAGSRRQSCENGGGLPSRPGWACGTFTEQFVSGRQARRVEGALVEGRRPGSWRLPSLTRRRAEAGLARGARWLGELERRKPLGGTRNGEARKGEPG
jgi:hypothetical protein